MSESLLAVIHEAREIARADGARPLLLCPVCGNRLDINRRGERNCDVGHFRSGATGGA